jgi:hypothetical protein
MATKQIEPNDWTIFFDEFSRQHQGETAILREVGPDIGDQEQAIGPAFVGISSDNKGSEPNSISIMLGVEQEDHLERTIAKPTRVYVLEGHTGSGGTAVQIEQEDGPRLILELRKVLELTGSR